MKINIYLDDIRECPKGFILARTVEEAIELIETNQVGVLSLDHDLGEDERGNLLKSGYDLVKYICQEGLEVEEIRFHTANPVGRENMYQTLIGAQRRGFIAENINIILR